MLCDLLEQIPIVLENKPSRRPRRDFVRLQIEKLESRECPSHSPFFLDSENRLFEVDAADNATFTGGFGTQLAVGDLDSTLGGGDFAVIRDGENRVYLYNANNNVFTTTGAFAIDIAAGRNEVFLRDGNNQIVVLSLDSLNANGTFNVSAQTTAAFATDMDVGFDPDTTENFLVFRDGENRVYFLEESTSSFVYGTSGAFATDILAGDQGEAFILDGNNEINILSINSVTSTGITFDAPIATGAFTTDLNLGQTSFGTDIMAFIGANNSVNLLTFSAGPPPSVSIDTIEGVLGTDVVIHDGELLITGLNGLTFTHSFEPDFPITGEELVTLELPALDVDLLGLNISSSPITVTVSTENGDGKLLGNLLETVTGIINVDRINEALNNVLSATVQLLNSVDLDVSGVGTGEFDNAPVSSTKLLDLQVAPVHLEVMGAHVTTSPIIITLTANAGEGLVLGNALTALTDLLNPPLPDELDLTFLNQRLDELLQDLNEQIPGIAPAPLPPPTLADGQVLSLTVPAIDLNLLGLVLETSPITVDAHAHTGDGLLLGNIATVILNELEATPQELSELSGNINEVLAKVVGVLNASTLTLPDDALDPLSDAIERLALPNLITATPGASAPILDLVIASTDGATPPVQVDLLGLEITTSDIDAHLTAVTGEGQVLGNLLYNVANLMNPGGPAALIALITDVATGSNTAGSFAPTNTTTTFSPEEIVTLVLPPIDLDLLGLEVRTVDPITVTISAQQGSGKLLGNTVTAVTSLLDTENLNNALNNVLESVVGLVNSVDLTVTGVGSGDFTSAPAGTTPILELFVAPVHLDLLGVIIETSPIELIVAANSGDGLVLGNILTALTDLFNPPLPAELDVDFLNQRLDELIADIRAQIPSIPVAFVPPPPFSEEQLVSLTVPAIDVNLLGLLLETSPITVNASAESGDGLLIGNLLTVVRNTLDATPEQLRELSGNINEVLAIVVGVLNHSTLTLPSNTVSSLPPVLQTLSLFNLISATPGQTTELIDLTIASTDGTTPPVIVDLMGLKVTTSDIDATVSAQTGDGQILGNLLYNVSHLLDDGTGGALLYLLTQVASLP